MTTCPLINVSFRSFALAGALACATALVPAPVYAQGPQLKLDQLDRLASRAKETVNVSLDQSMLQAAGGFLSGQQNTNNDAVKEMLSGLKGIYVRTFEFDTDNGYTESDLESVRSQLTAPWSRMVSVREKYESVDVYMWPQNNQAGGMAVIVADRRELVVVNIVGTINWLNSPRSVASLACRRASTSVSARAAAARLRRRPRAGTSTAWAAWRAASGSSANGARTTRPAGAASAGLVAQAFRPAEPADMTAGRTCNVLLVTACFRVEVHEHPVRVISPQPDVQAVDVEHVEVDRLEFLSEERRRFGVARIVPVVAEHLVFERDEFRPAMR
jgi:hypothetical protein